MDKTELVNTITQYVIVAAPYLKELGSVAGVEAAKEISKQAVRKIGVGTWTVAKSIWQKLQAASPAELTAIDSALVRVSANPNDMEAQTKLALELKNALKSNSSLFEQLAELMRQARAGTGEKIIAIGDGIIIGDGNVNVVNKRSS